MHLVLQCGSSRRPSWNRDCSSSNIVFRGVSVHFIRRPLFDDDRRASPELVASAAVLSSLTKALSTVACRASRLANSFSAGANVSVAPNWCSGLIRLRILPRRKHAALAAWAGLVACAIAEAETIHATDQEVLIDSWQVETRV